MNEYKNLSVPPQLHKRAKLLATRMDIRIIDVIELGLGLIETQAGVSYPDPRVFAAGELPHPDDAQVVPVIYMGGQ